jgi:MYXO-CTERM domain-containing protein
VAGAASPLSHLLMAKGSYAFLSAVSPVPEPATWAMWMLGVGLLGLRVRRRARLPR